MGFSPANRRSATAPLVSGIVVGALFGLAACTNGGGTAPTRPAASSSLSVTRPAPSAEAPSNPGPSGRPSRNDDASPEPTEGPNRTTKPAETKTTPPAEALPPAPNVTSASAAPTAAEPGGLGPVGWILLIGLVAALVGGVLIWRSRQKSAWNAEASALEADTRNATTTRLPSVLTAQNAAQRGLSWPPLRATLMDLVNRWDLLAEEASGEERTNWSLQIRSLLQDLIAAVDAENEALATGRDWRFLRPRVDQAERALAAALAGQASPMPPTAAGPQPPPYQP